MDEAPATRRTRPPAPRSVSREAQTYLSAVPPYGGERSLPDLDDVEGWLRLSAATDEMVCAMFADRVPPDDQLVRSRVELGGVPTYVLQPTNIPDDDAQPIFIDIHGGGLVHGGGDAAWMMSASKAVGRQGITWVPDFRNPPLHPYPAALDDCLAVYRQALGLRPPGQIVVHGESGGASLAGGLLLRAKDEGLPMPAALVLLTPEIDLTESGDSFQTNLGIDLLGSLTQQSLLYAGDHDLAHPYLSPLFGDLTGFPPTFLQTGTRDLFLSNAVRMHRRLLAAGVEAELHVFEAMPHGSFGGSAPEDIELLAETRRFEKDQLRRGSETGS